MTETTTVSIDTAPAAVSNDAAESSATQENTVNATAPTPEEPKVPAKGVQKRIDELTANWRTTERDRDHWRELALKNAAPPTPVVVPQGKPTLEQFEFDQERYMDALTDWKLSEREKAAEAKSKEKVEAESRTKRTQTFAEREATFAAGKEDYHTLARDPTLPVSQAMAEAILEAEDGPALLYHLGQHRDEAARISQMSPAAAAMAMGRIVAQLTAPASPPTPEPEISTAPPPAPIVKASAPPVKGLADDMSVKDWLKQREKDLARKRQAKVNG